MVKRDKDGDPTARKATERSADVERDLGRGSSHEGPTDDGEI